MKDIYSTSVTEATIDEAPMAYKPADEIIARIADTVQIKQFVRPIYTISKHPEGRMLVLKSKNGKDSRQEQIYKPKVTMKRSDFECTKSSAY